MAKLILVRGEGAECRRFPDPELVLVGPLPAEVKPVRNRLYQVVAVLDGYNHGELAPTDRFKRELFLSLVTALARLREGWMQGIINFLDLVKHLIRLIHEDFPLEILVATTFLKRLSIVVKANHGACIPRGQIWARLRLTPDPDSRSQKRWDDRIGTPISA